MILKLLRCVHSTIRILRRGIAMQTPHTSRCQLHYVICTVEPDDHRVKFYINDDHYTNDPRNALLLTSLDDASYTATLCAARRALEMWHSLFDGRQVGNDTKYIETVAMQASHWIEEVVDIDAFRSSSRDVTLVK